MLLPAAVLAVVTSAGKVASGWVAARPLGVDARARLRAGAVLIARGEFSVVVAGLGANAGHGDDLGAVAAAYVLLTAIIGPLAARYADNLGSRAEALATDGH